ncbi:MAG TPA: DUF3108 domain-containing protein [Longimicrobiaceae bacterium]|nr:DUF3108 domain-containing protein [Longimicrobiaceae bacterium]
MRNHHERLKRALGAALALASVALLGGARPQAADPHPFGAGERAEYSVRLAGIGVGSGSLVVNGVETVAGEQTYHVTMRVSGGRGPFRVNDRFDSWIDVDGLFSRRFHQNQHEVRFRRNRTYDFNPERRTFRRENGETGSIPTDKPLDDVSFIYYARTLPLDVGDVYELHRYFKADGNPVTLRVVRRETVEVPAGRFRTVVVQPVIRTDGLFGKGGHAEIYFSDDERRIPVLIKTRVPVVGSLSMHLKSYRPPS